MNKYDERSKEHFNKTAGSYESGLEGKMAAHLYESVLKGLNLSRTCHVLDIGCGPGTVLSRIADMNEATNLAGVDLSPEMARIAGDRLGKRAEVRVCNVCSEPLPHNDNSFDRVICMSTFHHFPDPRKALAEMHRVAKPGGGVTVADVTSFFPVRQFQNLYMSHFGKKGDVRFYSESEIRRLLEECRFQFVKWERVTDVALACLGMFGFVATAMPSK